MKYFTNKLRSKIYMVVCIIFFALTFFYSFIIFFFLVFLFFDYILCNNLRQIFFNLAPNVANAMLLLCFDNLLKEKTNKFALTKLETI